VEQQQQQQRQQQSVLILDKNWAVRHGTFWTIITSDAEAAACLSEWVQRRRSNSAGHRGIDATHGKGGSERGWHKGFGAHTTTNTIGAFGR